MRSTRPTAHTSNAASIDSRRRSLVLNARLAPEQGALLRKAMDTAQEAVDNGSAEPLSTGSDVDAHAQLRVDAPRAGGRELPGSRPQADRGGDRHLITVHVDAKVLAADSEGRCELDDGPALAAETALGWPVTPPWSASSGRARDSPRCRTQDPIHPAGHSSGPPSSRWRLLLPGMHQPPLHRRPSHPPLGIRRRDQLGQPRRSRISPRRSEGQATARSAGWRVRSSPRKWRFARASK